MIKERMLELLLLEKYDKLDEEIGLDCLAEGDIDYEKFDERLRELRKEFLSPYVIDNDSKG